MSVISGISRVRSHKAHSFYYNCPINPNDTISRGVVLDLFGSIDKKVGNVIINGFDNYIGEKYIQQVTLSFFLDNGSLNFIINYNTVKDALGKTIFPNRIVTRDQNGRNLLVIIKEREREEDKDKNKVAVEPLKIEIIIQHI
jgi:hypothetical protein